MAANIQAKILVLAASMILASLQFPAQAQGHEKERPVEHPISYRTIQIGGLSIFYREAGPKDGGGAETRRAATTRSRRPPFRRARLGRFSDRQAKQCPREKGQRREERRMQNRSAPHGFSRAKYAN